MPLLFFCFVFFSFIVGIQNQKEMEFFPVGLSIKHYWQ